MVADGVGVLAAAPDTEVITTLLDAEVDLEAALEAGAEGELDTVAGTLRKKGDDNPFFELWHNLMFFSYLPPPTMLIGRRFTSLSHTKLFLAHLIFSMVFA